MATITQLDNDKYLIKYVPEGYRTLYKNPYRSITVEGKNQADNIYKDAKLVEERDRISSKLNGKINSSELSKLMEFEDTAYGDEYDTIIGISFQSV